MEWVPDGDLAHFVSDLVETGALDLSAIYASYVGERGQPPYDPRLMVKLLLYGYATSVMTSHKLEAGTYRDLGEAHIWRVMMFSRSARLRFASRSRARVLILLAGTKDRYSIRTVGFAALRRRLLLARFALGTNMGIRRIVATGERGDAAQGATRPHRPALTSCRKSDGRRFVG